MNINILHKNLSLCCKIKTFHSSMSHSSNIRVQTVRTPIAPHSQAWILLGRREEVFNIGAKKKIIKILLWFCWPHLWGFSAKEKVRLSYNKIKSPWSSWVDISKLAITLGWFYQISRFIKFQKIIFTLYVQELIKTNGLNRPTKTWEYDAKPH